MGEWHFLVLAGSHGQVTCFGQQNLVLDLLAFLSPATALMEACLNLSLHQSESLTNWDEPSRSSDMHWLYGSLLRSTLKHLGCLLLQHNLASPDWYSKLHIYTHKSTYMGECAHRWTVQRNNGSLNSVSFPSWA